MNNKSTTLNDLFVDEVIQISFLSFNALYRNGDLSCGRKESQYQLRISLDEDKERKLSDLCSKLEMLRDTLRNMRNIVVSLINTNHQMVEDYQNMCNMLQTGRNFMKQFYLEIGRVRYDDLSKGNNSHFEARLFTMYNYLSRNNDEEYCKMLRTISDFYIKYKNVFLPDRENKDRQQFIKFEEHLTKKGILIENTGNDVHTMSEDDDHTGLGNKSESEDKSDSEDDTPIRKLDHILVNIYDDIETLSSNVQEKLEYVKYRIRMISYIYYMYDEINSDSSKNGKQKMQEYKEMLKSLEKFDIYNSIIDVFKSIKNYDEAKQEQLFLNNLDNLYEKLNNNEAYDKILEIILDFYSKNKEYFLKTEFVNRRLDFRDMEYLLSEERSAIKNTNNKGEDKSDSKDKGDSEDKSNSKNESDSEDKREDEGAHHTENMSKQDKINRIKTYYGCAEVKDVDDDWVVISYNISGKNKCFNLYDKEKNEYVNIDEINYDKMQQYQIVSELDSYDFIEIKTDTDNPRELVDQYITTPKLDYAQIRDKDTLDVRVYDTSKQRFKIKKIVVKDFNELNTTLLMEKITEQLQDDEIFLLSLNDDDSYDLPLDSEIFLPPSFLDKKAERTLYTLSKKDNITPKPLANSEQKELILKDLEEQRKAVIETDKVIMRGLIKDKIGGEDVELEYGKRYYISYDKDKQTIYLTIDNSLDDKYYYLDYTEDSSASFFEKLKQKMVKYIDEKLPKDIKAVVVNNSIGKIMSSQDKLIEVTRIMANYINSLPNNPIKLEPNNKLLEITLSDTGEKFTAIPKILNGKEKLLLCDSKQKVLVSHKEYDTEEFFNGDYDAILRDIENYKKEDKYQLTGDKYYVYNKYTEQIYTKTLKNVTDIRDIGYTGQEKIQEIIDTLHEDEELLLQKDNEKDSIYSLNITAKSCDNVFIFNKKEKKPLGVDVDLKSGIETELKKIGITKRKGYSIIKYISQLFPKYRCYYDNDFRRIYLNGKAGLFTLYQNNNPVTLDDIDISKEISIFRDNWGYFSEPFYLHRNVQTTEIINNLINKEKNIHQSLRKIFDTNQYNIKLSKEKITITYKPTNYSFQIADSAGKDIGLKGINLNTQISFQYFSKPIKIGEKSSFTLKELEDDNDFKQAISEHCNTYTNINTYDDNFAYVYYKPDIDEFMIMPIDEDIGYKKNLEKDLFDEYISKNFGEERQLLFVKDGSSYKLLKWDERNDITKSIAAIQEYLEDDKIYIFDKKEEPIRALREDEKQKYIEYFKELYNKEKIKSKIFQPKDTKENYHLVYEINTGTLKAVSESYKLANENEVFLAYNGTKILFYNSGDTIKEIKTYINTGGLGFLQYNSRLAQGETRDKYIENIKSKYIIPSQNLFEASYVKNFREEQEMVTAKKDGTSDPGRFFTKEIQEDVMSILQEEKNKATQALNEARNTSTEDKSKMEGEIGKFSHTIKVLETKYKENEKKIQEKSKYIKGLEEEVSEIEKQLSAKKDTLRTIKEQKRRSVEEISSIAQQKYITTLQETFTDVDASTMYINSNYDIKFINNAEDEYNDDDNPYVGVDKETLEDQQGILLSAGSEKYLILADNSVYAVVAGLSKNKFIKIEDKESCNTILNLCSDTLSSYIFCNRERIEGQENQYSISLGYKKFTVKITNDGKYELVNPTKETEGLIPLIFRLCNNIQIENYKEKCEQEKMPIFNYEKGEKKLIKAALDKLSEEELIDNNIHVYNIKGHNISARVDVNCEIFLQIDGDKKIRIREGENEIINRRKIVNTLIIGRGEGDEIEEFRSYDLDIIPYATNVINEAKVMKFIQEHKYLKDNNIIKVPYYTKDNKTFIIQFDISKDSYATLLESNGKVLNFSEYKKLIQEDSMLKKFMCQKGKTIYANYIQKMDSNYSLSVEDFEKQVGNVVNKGDDEKIEIEIYDLTQRKTAMQNDIKKENEDIQDLTKEQERLTKSIEKNRSDLDKTKNEIMKLDNKIKEYDKQEKKFNDIIDTLDKVSAQLTLLPLPSIPTAEPEDEPKKPEPEKPEPKPEQPEPKTEPKQPQSPVPEKPEPQPKTQPKPEQPQPKSEKPELTDLQANEHATNILNTILKKIQDSSETFTSEVQGEDVGVIYSNLDRSIQIIFNNNYSCSAIKYTETDNTITRVGWETIPDYKFDMRYKKKTYDNLNPEVKQIFNNIITKHYCNSILLSENTQIKQQENNITISYSTDNYKFNISFNKTATGDNKCDIEVLSLDNKSLSTISSDENDWKNKLEGYVNGTGIALKAFILNNNYDTVNEYIKQKDLEETNENEEKLEKLQEYLNEAFEAEYKENNWIKTSIQKFEVETTKDKTIRIKYYPYHDCTEYHSLTLTQKQNGQQVPIKIDDFDFNKKVQLATLTRDGKAQQISNKEYQLSDEKNNFVWSTLYQDMKIYSRNVIDLLPHVVNSTFYYTVLDKNNNVTIKSLKYTDTTEIEGYSFEDRLRAIVNQLEKGEKILISKGKTDKIKVLFMVKDGVFYCSYSESEYDTLFSMSKDDIKPKPLTEKELEAVKKQSMDEASLENKLAEIDKKLVPENELIIPTEGAKLLIGDDKSCGIIVYDKSKQKFHIRSTFEEIQENDVVLKRSATYDVRAYVYLTSLTEKPSQFVSLNILEAIKDNNYEICHYITTNGESKYEPLGDAEQKEVKQTIMKKISDIYKSEGLEISPKPLLNEDKMEAAKQELESQYSSTSQSTELPEPQQPQPTPQPKPQPTPQPQPKPPVSQQPPVPEKPKEESKNPKSNLTEEEVNKHATDTLNAILTEIKKSSSNDLTSITQGDDVLTYSNKDKTIQIVFNKFLNVEQITYKDKDSVKTIFEKDVDNKTFNMTYQKQEYKKFNTNVEQIFDSIMTEHYCNSILSAEDTKITQQNNDIMISYTGKKYRFDINFSKTDAGDKGYNIKIFSGDEQIRSIESDDLDDIDNYVDDTSIALKAFILNNDYDTVNEYIKRKNLKVTNKHTPEQPEPQPQPPVSQPPQPQPQPPVSQPPQPQPQPKPKKQQPKKTKAEQKSKQQQPPKTPASTSSPNGTMTDNEKLQKLKQIFGDDNVEIVSQNDKNIIKLKIALDSGAEVSANLCDNDGTELTLKEFKFGKKAKLKLRGTDKEDIEYSDTFTIADNLESKNVKNDVKEKVEKSIKLGTNTFITNYVLIYDKKEKRIKFKDVDSLNPSKDKIKKIQEKLTNNEQLLFTWNNDKNQYDWNDDKNQYDLAEIMKIGDNHAIYLWDFLNSTSVYVLDSGKIKNIEDNRAVNDFKESIRKIEKSMFSNPNDWESDELYYIKYNSDGTIKLVNYNSAEGDNSGFYLCNNEGEKRIFSGQTMLDDWFVMSSENNNNYSFKNSTGEINNEANETIKKKYENILEQIRNKIDNDIKGIKDKDQTQEEVQEKLINNGYKITEQGHLKDGESNEFIIYNKKEKEGIIREPNSIDFTQPIYFYDNKHNCFLPEQYTLTTDADLNKLNKNIKESKSAIKIYRKRTVNTVDGETDNLILPVYDTANSKIKIISLKNTEDFKYKTFDEQIETIKKYLKPEEKIIVKKSKDSDYALPSLNSKYKKDSDSQYVLPSEIEVNGVLDLNTKQVIETDKLDYNESLQKALKDINAMDSNFLGIYQFKKDYTDKQILVCNKTSYTILFKKEEDIGEDDVIIQDKRYNEIYKVEVSTHKKFIDTVIKDENFLQDFELVNKNNMVLKESDDYEKITEAIQTFKANIDKVYFSDDNKIEVREMNAEARSKEKKDEIKLPSVPQTGNSGMFPPIGEGDSQKPVVPQGNSDTSELSEEDKLKLLDEELRKARLLNQQLLLQKQQQQLDGQELPEMSRYMMGEPKEDVYLDEQLINQHEDQVLIENRRVVDNPNRLKRQENNFDNIRDDIVLPKAQKDHRPLFYTLTTIASAAVLTTLFAATTMGAGAIIACAVGTFGIPSTLFGIFYKKPKNSIDIYDISAKNSRSNTRSNTTRSNNRSLDLNTRRNNISPVKSNSSSRMPNSLVNLHQANTSNNNVQTPILNSNNGDKNKTLEDKLNSL